LYYKVIFEVLTKPKNDGNNLELKSNFGIFSMIKVTFDNGNTVEIQNATVHPNSILLPGFQVIDFSEANQTEVDHFGRLVHVAPRTITKNSW
jgi:acetyltransferase-like isoleucine patch superfamily enzyme